jgi:hypothetical protein
MGICPLNPKEEGGEEADWLVILFDGAVQAGARSIVGHAAISIRMNFVTPGLDPGVHHFSKESCEEDGWPGQARP